MKLSIKTIAIACLIVGVTSCKKDATPTPAPTKTELLTGKNWKVTAFTSNPAIDWTGTGVMVTDIYAQMQACEKDDLFMFNTNGTTTDDEGATKCNPADPQTTSGTWAFNSTQTIITVDGMDDFNIETLSATTLKGNMVFNDGATNYTFTITYTKQ